MPTLDEIKLTAEQEKLMIEMIREVLSTKIPLKQTVFFQKWTKKIFQAGAEAEWKELLKWKPTLHYCPNWDFLLIDKNDPESQACTCFDKTRQ